MAFNSEAAMHAKAERMLNKARESSKLDVDEYQDQSLGEAHSESWKLFAQRHQKLGNKSGQQLRSSILF